MNKNLEKYFVETYPKIFSEMYGPVATTCMHYGITCGDGWFNILDALCNKIQSRIDLYEPNQINDGLVPIPQVVAKQIKEKFGTLSFYYIGGDVVIHSYIDMAESLSAFVCEDCGISDFSIGQTTNWIRTLCPKCAQKYMSEKFRENEKFIQNKQKLKLFEETKQSTRRKN